MQVSWWKVHAGQLERVVGGFVASGFGCGSRWTKVKAWQSRRGEHQLHILVAGYYSSCCLSKCRMYVLASENRQKMES
jgi:hypothetical protein